MTDRADEIAGRLEAATPGPWHTSRSKRWVYNTAREGFDDEPVAEAETVPDADFIANAPSDIAWLLGRLAEVTAERDEMQRRIDFLLLPVETPRPEVGQARIEGEAP